MSSQDTFSCAICWETVNLTDRVTMPCCGQDSSSIQYCRQCLVVISEQGIEGKIGKCPTCSDYFTFENGEIRSQHDVPVECTICKQFKTVVVQLREGFSLCPPCVLGSRHMFHYECDRCHLVQMIPHPMWSFQATPEAYSSVTWACHMRCGDYTHWRIVPEDALSIPQGHVPESWGQREAWLTTIRDLSLRRRRERLEEDRRRRAQQSYLLNDFMKSFRFGFELLIFFIIFYVMQAGFSWVFDHFNVI